MWCLHLTSKIVLNQLAPASVSCVTIYAPRVSVNALEGVVEMLALSESDITKNDEAKDLSTYMYMYM